MDAVIFDVDGTLWDSRAEVADSWRLLCSVRKVPCAHITPERLKAEFGKPMSAIADSLFPDLPENERLALGKELCIFEVEYLKTHFPNVYDGVRELFTALTKRGLPLFIVSNCQAGYIEDLLETNNLTEYVKDHLCPDDTGLDKAGNIREIIRRYSLTDPVYVGDTMGDFSAANAAGCPFIHAAYGFGEVPEAGRSIEEPLGLLKWM